MFMTATTSAMRVVKTSCVACDFLCSSNIVHNTPSNTYHPLPCAAHVVHMRWIQHPGCWDYQDPNSHSSLEALTKFVLQYVLICLAGTLTAKNLRKALAGIHYLENLNMHCSRALTREHLCPSFKVRWSPMGQSRQHPRRWKAVQLAVPSCPAVSCNVFPPWPKNRWRRFPWCFTASW